jgi:prepilin-type processing-associated H-X9-DG protein/prepilin-type N-terminal cleavage/methylation domain-containing protein
MRLKAFTLVELLIVIAIISLLMAVLVPILSKSKAQANVIYCSANLKQISAAFYIYDSDNKTLPFGFMPTGAAGLPSRGFIGNSTVDPQGWHWPDFLRLAAKGSFGNKSTILQCPSKNLNDVLLKNDILCGNYGVNISICKLGDGALRQLEFVGKPLPINSIKKPASTFLAADSGYTIISWQHAADVPPFAFNVRKIVDTAYIPGLKINSKRSFKPGQKDDAVGGRHSNKTVNTAYVDGHVSREKASIFLVEKKDKSYTNQSPLWVP